MHRSSNYECFVTQGCFLQVALTVVTNGYLVFEKHENCVSVDDSAGFLSSRGMLKMDHNIKKWKLYEYGNCVEELASCKAMP